jgi:hypothetical protein
MLLGMTGKLRDPALLGDEGVIEEELLAAADVDHAADGGPGALEERVLGQHRGCEASEGGSEKAAASHAISPARNESALRRPPPSPRGAAG